MTWTRAGTARRGRAAVATFAVAVCVLCGLTACRGTDTGESTAYEPARVQDVAGSEEKEVVLTSAAASRVSLRVEPAVAAGPASVVPYASLIYDGQGATWVYVGTAPLTFRRTAVVVERIDDDAVVLSRGPSAGSLVVTVGATEVYGAELGIAGGH